MFTLSLALKSSPSSAFPSQTHTHTQRRNTPRTNWLWTGVNRGPFKKESLCLNTLPPSKSLLLNKGVKRCFCLPSFHGRRESLKDTNEHEDRNKVANSQWECGGIRYMCEVIKISKRATLWGRNKKKTCENTAKDITQNMWESGCRAFWWGKVVVQGQLSSSAHKCLFLFHITFFFRG